jgi:hypothetical protein
MVRPDHIGERVLHSSPSFEVCTWTLLPGVELVAHRFENVVAVYYQVGRSERLKDTTRTWHAEELLARRRVSGLALTFGEG